MKIQLLAAQALRWFHNRKPKPPTRGAFGSVMTTRVDEDYNRKLRRRARNARLRKPAMLPAFARDGFKTPEEYYDAHSGKTSNPLFHPTWSSREAYAKHVLGEAEPA